MQTHFTPAQLEHPAMRESERIFRACVHCGFCIATCPTYVTLGDECDSPRGRIYLIKDMLESGDAVPAATVAHVDRCLSCLSCMTTCPSGVDYMHLVDHARVHIAEAGVRPLADRAMRRLVATVLPRPGVFRLALVAAMLVRPLAGVLPARLRTLVATAPRRLASPSPVDRPQVFPAKGERRARAALLTGCVQTVLNPAINEATIRLLTRLGCEVVVARGSGCCGAVAHHLGLEAEALVRVRANVAAWAAELEGEGLDAVVVNASGCGTSVKDYGFLLRNEPDWAGPAARIAELAVDVSELVARLDYAPNGAAAPLTVAYHAACSLQHGQKITALPRDLLAAAGFRVREVPEGHLCCGSAGTYSLFQPAIAARLRRRKLDHIEGLSPDAVAAGNIGCIEHLAAATRLPVVHTVELLDWASGGPRPAALGPG